MMIPPIYPTVATDAGVSSVLGPNAERFYPFHDAPETPDTPYALWQMIGGAPENYVNQRPDIDGFSVQIDVYADTVADAMNVAEKLRDAIEPHAYVVAWRGTVREPGTRLYRYSFDVDWLVSRPKPVTIYAGMNARRSGTDYLNSGAITAL